MNAVAGRDITVVMGQTVIIAAMYIVIIYITDILYTFVDPRIRILHKVNYKNIIHLERTPK